jgi:O-antigen ligase
MTRAPARPVPSARTPSLAGPDVGSDVLRFVVLAALVLAPLLFGAFYPWAYGPLHVVAYACGLLAVRAASQIRAAGGTLPPLPAFRILLAFLAFVGLQLVPLPPPLLRFVSPGSFAFYDRLTLLGLEGYRPVTVSGPDTFFGLVYLGGLSLLYFAVFHAFARERWRRRLLRTIAYVGVFLSLEALAQAASGTKRIYGVFEVPGAWDAFGPYFARSHFGGYLLLALGPALGFTAEALANLSGAWSRRRGWLALGDPVGSAFVRRAVETLVIVVGLVAAASRGAFVGFVFALVVFALLTRRRLLLAGILVVAVLGVSWIGLDTIIHGFRVRGIEASRIGLWRDALQIFPDFPIFGAGFNAFGMAYLRYQTFWRYYHFQASHNEYLDLFLTTGIVGTALALYGLGVLLRTALSRALHSPLDAGLLAGLLGVACHNLVDFNWQIQANAATFVALLAVAVRPLDRSRAGP